MTKKYALALVLAGCGTYVGNPKKTDGGSTTKEFAPTEIDFTIPNGVASYDETSPAALSLSSSNFSSEFRLNANEQMRLTQAGVEFLKAIKKTNRIIRKFATEEKIRSEGKTSKTLDSRKISVEYRAIASDGYTASMQVCLDGHNLLYMRWNDKGKKEIFHSGAPKLLNRSSENIISKITVDPDSQGGTIGVQNSGETDDNFESIRSFRSSVTMFKQGDYRYLSYSKAVSSDDKTFSPTRYLLSRFDENSVGSFVFWERQCRGSHVEPVDGSAGWCKGGRLSGTSAFETDGERNNAAQEMITQGASWARASSLSSIVFPVDCGN